MLNKTCADTMPGLLRTIREQFAGRVMLKEMIGREVHTVTGDQFFELADRLACGLYRKGLAGKHIGIMGCNRMRWFAHLCAVFMTGGVAVLLSPELSGEETAARTAQTDLSAIVCDDALRQNALIAHIPVLSMDECGVTDHCACPEVTDRETPACIIFTSGSTGTPKAALFSHRALVAGICHNVIPVPFEAHLAILPLHHIAGFASVLNTWYLGRMVCLGREVGHLYRYLRDMQPDYVLTVPEILQALLKKLKNADDNGRNLGWNLRLVGCGGAAFLPEAVRILGQRNIRILQSYGATEIGGIGFDWEMTEASAGSIGKPCPELETKIVDGELYLRSPSAMSGYYKDPEATARVLIDGWYATGDLCEFDDGGFLRLKGRKRNVIILPNGENVSPEEVEGALRSFELTEDVMVGLDGQLITAYVLPRQGIGRHEIQCAVDAYNRNSPRSRQIQQVVFQDKPFRKTEIGKIIRESVTGGNRN